jgi:hypothetical protein
MCQRASTSGDGSSVPGRRPTGPTPSSSPANTCVPHSPQNHFGFPVAGRQTRSSSKPSVISSAAPGTRATRLEDCPERIWQRLQWQRPASVKGGVMTNRTAPQRQRPMNRSSDEATTGIVGTLDCRAQPGTVRKTIPGLETNLRPGALQGRLLGGEMLVPEADQGPRDGHRLPTRSMESCWISRIGRAQQSRQDCPNGDIAEARSGILGSVPRARIHGIVSARGTALVIDSYLGNRCSPPGPNIGRARLVFSQEARPGPRCCIYEPPATSSAETSGTVASASTRPSTRAGAGVTLPERRQRSSAPQRMVGPWNGQRNRRRRRRALLATRPTGRA